MKKGCFLIIPVIILIIIGIFFYVKSINLPEEEQGNVQEPQLDKQEIMQDVAERIGGISPVEPVLGGSWYVNRFWFVNKSSENFYVEYEDGHILRQVLLVVEKKKDKLEYNVTGYFEPGETTWILKDGKDEFFGSGLDLYEYDEESEWWVKKN